MVVQGQKAADFNLQDENENRVSLAEVLEKGALIALGSYTKNHVCLLSVYFKSCNSFYTYLSYLVRQRHVFKPETA